MSTVDTDSGRELRFAVGTFVGVLISGFGIAFYFLGTARGVRQQTGGFIPDGLQQPIPVVGLDLLTFLAIVVMFVALVGRLYRSKFPRAYRSYATTVATLVLIVGFGVFSLSVGAETNADAPWITAGEVPVTLLVGLVGGFVFPLAQLSRLSRGDRLLTRRQKGMIALGAVVLMVVALVPGVVYVGGLMAGNASAGASQVLPVPGIMLGAGMHKVLLFTVAFEMMFVGYAVLRTAAKSVGW